jgi:hypothetical protein
MLVLGAGLGFVMQVLVLAAQNAVPYALLGVATSSATLFRSIGGSLGTAILGAIFANRLADSLASHLGNAPGAAALAGGTVNPDQIKALPAALHERYVTAFTDSLSTVFLIAAAVVALAFILSLFLQERPLRQTISDRDAGDAFPPPPCSSDSLNEITGDLSRLAGRERTRRFLAGVIERAEVDLTPAEIWLLGQVRDGAIPDPALRVSDPEDLARLDEALTALRGRGLVEAGDGRRLTEAGQTTRDRVQAARCEGLESLVADWQPQSPELDEAIERLSEELGREAERV